MAAKQTDQKSNKGKKESAGRNGGQGRSGNRKTAKRTGDNASFSSQVREEILLLAASAVCILLVLSIFGVGGAVGNWISGLFFGLFGFPAYLFPFLIFAVSAFLLSNRGSTHAYIKAGAAGVFYLLICSFSELVTNQYSSANTLVSYYTSASVHKNGGGIVSGCILKLSCPLIGEIGTCVVLIFLSVICVVLITEKSLLSPLGRQGRRAYEAAKRKHEKSAEDRRRRRAIEKQPEKSPWGDYDVTEEEQGQIPEDRQERRRIGRRITGVSFDTTLKPKEEEGSGRRRGRKHHADTEEITHEYDEPRLDGGVLADGAFSYDSAQEGRVDGSDEMKRGTGQSSPRKQKLSRQESAEAVLDVEKTIQRQEAAPKPVYHMPPLRLLTRGSRRSGDSEAHLRETARKLEETFSNFGVGVRVTNASCGPSVTRYELQPEQGVKVSRIVGLADDIKLNLAVADLRIEAPIPGKAAVGIEVPNEENTTVMLRDLLESPEFKNSKSPLSFAVGRDIAGKVVVADIAKMPHLLVAGATGSGKSVCINTLITSILYKSEPDKVKLILVDPKVVELSIYNGIPHLMIPVVTDPKKAAGALNWAVAEMDRRYKLFAEYNVRDLKGYNERAVRGETDADGGKPLPQIVIIIDELADLMMVAPGEVEGAICRLAQLARAAGLHLVLATQRPSVNVITGLIKANMPSRIAFAVSSGVDSRTIIDMNGAEKLLGKGDMLFYPTGYPKPVRVQGSFISDREVQSVTDYLISNNGNTSYSEEIQEQIEVSAASDDGVSEDGMNERDTYFEEAGKLIIDKEKASIGMLQRMFKIGFNRAARIMDQLADAGVVGPEEGTKPRKVLMTKAEFEEYLRGGTQDGNPPKSL